MGAAVALGDVVGEGQHHFVVAVVPPHRDLDPDVVARAVDIDRLRHERGLGPVEILHEFLDATFVEQLGPERHGGAFVRQDDADAGVEEGEFPQALFQRVEMIVEVGERPLGVGLAVGGEKAHFCPALAGGGSDHTDVFHGLAVSNRAKYSVSLRQTRSSSQSDSALTTDTPTPCRRRDLVGVAFLGGVVEFSAGVQLGHDDLGGGHAFFLVHVDRDSAPVVAHRYAGIRVDRDLDLRGVSGQRLVDAVVHDLIHHVVQARAVIGVTDIHAWPLAHSVQALENPDGIGAVTIGCGVRVGHAENPCS